MNCRHCRRYGRYHRHRRTIFSQPLFYGLVLITFGALAAVDYFG